MALVEIRYSAGDTSINADQGLEIQRILVENDIALPRIQPAQKQQIALNIDSAGPSSQVEIQGQGWQLLAGDGVTAITVMPDSISVQTGRYERWSVSIQPILTALVGAIAKTLGPELIYRIGTRFVNRLVDVDADSPQAWIGRIDPVILGAVTSDTFGRLLVSTQQQMELRLGTSERALIRHGAFADAAQRNSYSYLVDTDVFTLESMRFSPESIERWTRLLNVTALSIFQQIVTPEYRDEMGPVEVDDAQQA